MSIWKRKIGDIFLRGVVAGGIAGTLKDLPDILANDVFRIKHQSFWDYVSIMTLNRRPGTLLEHAVAVSLEIAFSLGIGVVYSVFVVPNVPTDHYLLRGLIYGGMCWFLLISLLKLFNLAAALPAEIVTPLLTLVFSAVYGLMLAFIDKKLTPTPE